MSERRFWQDTVACCQQRKKVADYLLKNIDTVEKMTTFDLVTKTNTSKAAVTRLCQYLGFKGF